MLSTDQSRTPLLLTSSKSWMGHAEPAAGINGLLHAACTMAHLVQLPLLHLHTLSPHVTQAMHRHALTSAPRQPGPLATPAHHVGVSSFGFSGSNTHAILSNGGDMHSGAVSLAATTVWHHKPMWCVPQLEPWAMHCVRASASSMVLRGRLPVDIQTLLVHAPLHAWQCAWANAVMDAVCACTDATLTALVNVVSSGHVPLQQEFDIHVDLVKGAVEVMADNKTAMTAMLQTIEKDQKGEAVEKVCTLLFFRVPGAALTSSMSDSRDAAPEHLRLLAACQAMALEGKRVVELASIISSANNAVPTTMAAMGSVCAVGSVRVETRSVRVTPPQLVYKLAMQAAGHSGRVWGHTSLLFVGVCFVYFV